MDEWERSAYEERIRATLEHADATLEGLEERQRQREADGTDLAEIAERRQREEGHLEGSRTLSQLPLLHGLQ